MHLAILIPSRNRPDLVERAIRSVRRQKSSGDVTVFVSDNSSDESRFTSTGPDYQVIRPDGELPMAQHWEWATSRIFEAADFTHLMVLTDRLILADGALDRLWAQVAASPSVPVVFPLPAIEDFRTPISYRPRVATGATYSISCDHLAHAIAAGNCSAWPTPRPMNGIIPIELLRRILQDHGHIYGTLSPDYHSAYHILGATKRLVAVDDVLVVQHSLGRSNGMAGVYGQKNAALKDFESKVENELVPVVPIPEIHTTSNFIFHEYLDVREELGADSSLPPLELDGYRSRLRADLARMKENPELAAEYAKHLGGEPIEMQTWTMPFRRYVPFVAVKHSATLARRMRPSRVRIRNLDQAIDYATRVRPVRHVPPTEANWPPGAVEILSGDTTKGQRA